MGMTEWKIYMEGFRNYLMLERSLSPHSVEAYISDVCKLMEFDINNKYPRGPKHLKRDEIEGFISSTQIQKLNAKSQARIISGIKAFYKYLLLEDLIYINPTRLVETPRLKRKLPDTLSFMEIEVILNHMDMSLPHAHRNKAVIETLYACGLRVTELVNLKISHYFPDLGWVKVTGKNDKERMVPIAPSAIYQIDLYMKSERVHLNIHKDHTDYIFLNRRGKKITRISIFQIIKEVVEKAGIKKNVSPHTFRHSFASHLVEGGADLRAVQEMLGHESITTTEIYTHVNTDYLRETLMLYHPGNRKT